MQPTVWSFVASQLRARRARTLALGLAIVVAATSFTLLVSTARTSSAQLQGTVKSNYRAAYDILVRPRGSVTQLERTDRLVRPNFLAGVFGGISFEQWRTVEHVRGVEVAAPVANVGFILPLAAYLVPLNDIVSKAPFQLYRIRSSWVADAGLSRYPAGEQYVYYTPQDRFVLSTDSGRWVETGIGIRAPLPSCSGFSGIFPRSPFPPLASLAYLSCFPTTLSARGYTVNSFVGPTPTWIGARVDAHFPIYVAAIDPVEEAELVHLDRALVGGRYLRPKERLSPYEVPGISFKTIPVLASSRSYVDEHLDLTIERLRIPTGTNVPRALATGLLPPPKGADYRDARTFVQRAQGDVVARRVVRMDAIYRNALTKPPPNVQWRAGTFSIDAYWTTSRARYRSLGRDRLAPVPMVNPPSVWRSQFGYGGFYLPPRDNQDLQFRRLHERVQTNTITGRTADYPLLRVVGQFDPKKLPSFSPLSKVPLETYFPPELVPSDAAAKRALQGQPLLPSQNLGGYIQPPPFFLTTMEALEGFLSPNTWSRGVYAQADLSNGSNVTAIPRAQRDAPISAIRVRVNGVTGPNELSLARVRAVATAIHDATGLQVDITAGSSPHPVSVLLPKGRFGRPPLLLEEGWSKKGVAVSFVKALERKDAALFALILVLGGFFIANSALASVRTRRAEIGTLLTLGWDRSAIFQVILGELCILGLAAGLVGTGIAAALVSLFSLEASPLALAFVTPVAVGLAALSGLVPASLASRGTPLDTLRPPVLARASRMLVRNLAALALTNLSRLPGRAFLGAAGLALGVGALTVLLAIERAFQGTLVGTLLGNVISVEASGFDFLAVSLVIAFAALSVADVLYLNLRERSAELVTLRTLGWSERHVVSLVGLEALALGLAGSLIGACLGLALGAALLGVPAGPLALAALLAAAGGLACALLASLLPLSQISRLTAPAVLAEE